MYKKELENIIARTEEFINNDKLDPRDIGSFIYGATGARDDYDDIIKEYPEIEELSEEGLSLEVNRGDSDFFLARLRKNFEAIKRKYRK